MDNNREFDAIVVGSGASGSTIARELSKRGKRVLILERGGDAPLKETLLATASIMSAVRVGEKLVTARAFSTGGTTSVYFAVADMPPLETFLSLGIDLSGALEEAKRELPLAVLPDELLGAQALRVRRSAMELGYQWEKNTMLVDLAKCPSGYRAEAKWNARSYLREAVEQGATLITRARVTKVLIDEKRAIGVEYKVGKGKKVETRQAFGAKVVLAAGSASSPRFLRDSGLANVANRGFYCHPTFAIFGLVPGLKAGPNFVGSMGAHLEDDIALGDANAGRAFHRMFMLGHRRFLRAFMHSKSIGVGVMVKDGLGGEMLEGGRYNKQLTKEDYRKLEKGEQMARQIIENAGGKHIYKTPLSAAHLGGTIRIKEHLDEHLQTEYSNLHVCDGAVIPETVRVSPALTLICLGKYLANHLAQTI